MGQTILEQVAVRKIGQQIVVGLVGQALQARLALDRIPYGAQQALAGILSVDPEILGSVPDHRQRQIRVGQESKHDDRDAGGLQQKPVDALRPGLPERQRTEQDDIERIRRQPFDGAVQPLNVNEFHQSGTRHVEEVSRDGGAIRVFLDQQHPNRSWISHTRAFPRRDP